MGGSLRQGRREQEREKGWGCRTSKEQWAGVMDRTQGENKNGRERSIGKMVKESIEGSGHDVGN